MSRRRVVITGLGIISPVGNTIAEAWVSILAGRSGIARISRFDASRLPCQIAGEVKDFNPEQWIEKRDIKKMDLFIQYAVASAVQAMKQSGLQINDDNADSVGVLVDDMIDTAGTVTEAAKVVVNAGAIEVIACATHAILSDPACERLNHCHVQELITTNTVPLRPKALAELRHLKVLSVAELIAEAGWSGSSTRDIAARAGGADHHGQHDRDDDGQNTTTQDSSSSVFPR